MKEITPKQRQQLKSLAHAIKPVIMIGKQGLTESVILATAKALLDHELVKIKFIDHKDEKNEMKDELIKKCDAQFVNKIGNTLVLYRELSDPAKRKIKLSEKKSKQSEPDEE